MNIEEAYKNANMLRRSRSTSAQAFGMLREIATELELRFSALTQTELRTLTDCYSSMYLISLSAEVIRGDLGSLDRMLFCLKRYMALYPDLYPEDAAFYDNCFFTLQAGFYYEELFSLVNKLYHRGGSGKKVALQWLTAPLFLYEEFLTPQEQAVYKEEASRYFKR